MTSLNIPVENQSEMKIVNDVASDKEIKSPDSLATPKTTGEKKYNPFFFAASSAFSIFFLIHMSHFSLYICVCIYFVGLRRCL